MEAPQERPLDEHPTMHTPEGRRPSSTGVGATPEPERTKDKPADPKPQRIWPYIAYAAIGIGMVVYALLIADWSFGLR